MCFVEQFVPNNQLGGSHEGVFRSNASTGVAVALDSLFSIGLTIITV